MKKLIMALLMAGTATAGAMAADFPTPSIISPIMGLSTFSTVSVTWEYTDLHEGPQANRMITITTPSGKQYTSKGYTEYILKDDPGGSLDQSNPEGENALTVSYYNDLAKEGTDIAGFTEKGVYTLSIPEGAITIDGVPNPAVELTYNLGLMLEMGPATAEFVNDAANPMLKLSWDNQKITTTRAASSGIGASLTRLSDDAESELYGAPFSFNEESTVLNISLAGRVSRAGEYTLEFPGGQIQNEKGEVNRTQVFTITVTDESGVTAIEAASSFKVFTLDGVKVMETEDAAMINNLPTGIYIVNGKKYIVK